MGAPSITASELFDRAAIENPYPLFARLRAEAPVCEIEGTGIWMVSSWALVEEAVGRDDDFSANLTGMLYTGPDGGPAIFELGEIAASAGAVIATADDPDHAIHRAAVQPAMVAAVIAREEGSIRRETADRTQALVDDGAGDYAVRVAEPVPTIAMARLLGLPREDCDRLQRWAMTGGDMLAGTATPERMAELGAQTGEMAAYLSEKIGAARESTAICGALARAVEAGHFDLGAAIGIAVTLVGAGGESTASLIGNAVRLLAGKPALQARLRAEPTLVPRFVEEALRLESPFRFHYRVVKHDCELGGVALRAGQRLMLGWAPANRDEQAFERADELVLDRRHPKRHFGFGRGRHFCVGAHLARLEARLAVEELLGRTRSLALDPGAPARHIPSVFVRRLECLPVVVEPA